MAVTVLLRYAYEDRDMAAQLKNHLSSLEHNRLISILDDRNIDPGAEREKEITRHLNEAQIILLLISASFLASKYRFRMEMQGDVKRHESKKARVIPIILRPVNWDIPPIDKLQALPDNGKAISDWKNRDKGFKIVADGVLKVVEQWNADNLPNPIEKRRELMANLDKLIETIKLQMQPPPRATAAANTLQQLSIFIPNKVTLADLIVGWRTLSHSSNQDEDPATKQRRATCGELANMASQFTTEQGNLAQSIETWQAWQEAFKNSDDPRQNSMAKTFERELGELQEASR